MSKASTMIRQYVNTILAECVGEDEVPAAILTAVVQAQNATEIEHLGRALLSRHESLCDASYGYGGENYDPALQAIAEALGWSA